MYEHNRYLNSVDLFTGSWAVCLHLQKTKQQEHEGNWGPDIFITCAIFINNNRNLEKGLYITGHSKSNLGAGLQKPLTKLFQTSLLYHEDGLSWPHHTEEVTYTSVILCHWNWDCVTEVEWFSLHFQTSESEVPTSVGIPYSNWGVWQSSCLSKWILRSAFKSGHDLILPLNSR
jgi:hypothetical protein